MNNNHTAHDNDNQLYKIKKNCRFPDGETVIASLGFSEVIFFWLHSWYLWEANQPLQWLIKLLFLLSGQHLDRCCRVGRTSVGLSLRRLLLPSLQGQEKGCLIACEAYVCIVAAFSMSKRKSIIINHPWNIFNCFKRFWFIMSFMALTHSSHSHGERRRVS